MKKQEVSPESGGSSADVQVRSRKRILPPEVLLEEYRELLKNEEIEALPLIISGNSMSPFLIHGRDTVYLSRLERPVRKGDVLLYQRESGAYILHRVYRVERADDLKGSEPVLGSATGEVYTTVSGSESALGAAIGEIYTMVGDGQTVLEPGIRRNQVIAIMTSAERKGKRQAPGCFWWEFFEKVWIRMVPVRRVVRGVYTAVRKVAAGPKKCSARSEDRG